MDILTATMYLRRLFYRRSKNCSNNSDIQSGRYKKPNNYIQGRRLKKKPNNYRPISILTIFSTIFEKYKYLNLTNYVDENQYHVSVTNKRGFRKGISTDIAIGNFLNQVIQLHSLRYKRTYASSIRILSKRQQYVKVGGVKSAVESVSIRCFDIVNEILYSVVNKPCNLLKQIT